MNILSLGVGVQSSTVLMMANKGLLKIQPEAAVFADTGDEPDEVYQYLGYLQSISKIPIFVQRDKNILEGLDIKLQTGKRYAQPPFFVKNQKGKLAKLPRACTKEYKIEMVERAVRRQVLGLKPRQRIPKGFHVNMIIGISTDEIERVKPSTTPWATRVHPLIDDVEMSRTDCQQWMAKEGYLPPPRSSCRMCPYHSDSEWARLMADPKDREHIIEIDRKIRNGWKGLQEGVELYLHRSLTPIGEIKFTDTGEGAFTEECEGMCGI